ncbi:MAG: PorT family protein [Pedobacter sp.]|nr:MAG: PorT family protein [Pedobacter sp.]
MKKVMIMTAFALSAFCAQAQEKSIRLGAKIGANFSLFSRSVEPFDQKQGTRFEYFDRDARISGMGGLTAEFILTKGFSLGVEFLYTTRGMAYKEKNNHVVILNEEGRNTASNRYTYNIDYLEVPVTINYNFNDASSSLRLVGYMGIAPAMVVNSRTTLRYADGVDGDGYRAANENNKLTNVRLYNNNILFGFQVGENSSKRLGGYLDLRGTHTLRPIFQGTNNIRSMRNTNMLSFTLAVGIRI